MAPCAAKSGLDTSARRRCRASGPGRAGSLRLIDVTGYDLSACGGTHVERTGGIGVIAIGSAEKFKGGINQEVTLKVDKEGVYGVKCMPHYAMGMVALIQVGAAGSNLDAVRTAVARTPPIARRRFTEMLTRIR